MIRMNPLDVTRVRISRVATTGETPQEAPPAPAHQAPPVHQPPPVSAPPPGF